MVAVMALYKILDNEKVKILDENSTILYEGNSSDIPIRCMNLWVNSLKYEKGCYIIKTN